MTRLSRELFQVAVGDRTPRMWRPETHISPSLRSSGRGNSPSAIRISSRRCPPVRNSANITSAWVVACKPDHNVLENRHFAKELKVLVCPADTSPSPLVGTKSADFCAAKHDLSRRWTKLTADKIEKSCFPGTIRTDYAANLSGRHANVNGVNGSEAAKPLRYVF